MPSRAGSPEWGSQGRQGHWPNGRSPPSGQCSDPTPSGLPRRCSHTASCSTTRMIPPRPTRHSPKPWRSSVRTASTPATACAIWACRRWGRSAIARRRPSWHGPPRPTGAPWARTTRSGGGRGPRAGLGGWGGANDWGRSQPLEELGELEIAAGEAGAAVVTLRRAHALDEKLFGTVERSSVARTDLLLARALLARGEGGDQR